MSYHRKQFIEGRHYSINKKNGCWEWLGALNTKGYATTSVNRVTKLASRTFYELFCGKIPIGLVVDHLCRNPKCVNSTHLEPVRQIENVRRGLRVKLSPKDVVDIRSANGRTQREMAVSFGVNQSEISRIINNKRYA